MVISHPETLSQTNPEMFILGTLWPVMLTYKLTTIPLLLGVLPSLHSVAYKLRCGFQSQLLRLLGTSVSIKIMKQASPTDCCVIQWGHVKDAIGLAHCRYSKEGNCFFISQNFQVLGSFWMPEAFTLTFLTKASLFVTWLLWVILAWTNIHGVFSRCSISIWLRGSKEVL